MEGTCSALVADGSPGRAYCLFCTARTGGVRQPVQGQSGGSGAHHASHVATARNATDVTRQPERYGVYKATFLPAGAEGFEAAGKAGVPPPQVVRGEYHAVHPEAGEAPAVFVRPRRPGVRE